MLPKIKITDDSLEQIRDRAVGICGVEVEDQQHSGVRFILMTVDGYEQLKQLVYDDRDLTPEEMMAAAIQLDVSENNTAAGSNDYDKLD